MRNFWRAGTRVPEHDDGRLRRRTLGLVLLLSVALVSSHQLTPLVLAFSLAGLVLVRRSWAPLLPVILGLLLVLWMLYPASTYLVGHPVFGADEAGVVQANLTGRVVGSPGHLAVQGVRIALTIARVGAGGARGGPELEGRVGGTCVPTSWPSSRSSCFPSSTTAGRCCCGSRCSRCRSWRSSPPAPWRASGPGGGTRTGGSDAPARHGPWP